MAFVIICLCLGVSQHRFHGRDQWFRPDNAGENNAIANLTALMEPIVIVFLGVVIGGLVISMYLPIFQLGSVISQ